MLICMACVCVFKWHDQPGESVVYMMQQLEYLRTGKDTQVVINDDEARKDSTTQEKEAQILHKELGVEIPGLSFKPDGMEYLLSGSRRRKIGISTISIWRVCNYITNICECQRFDTSNRIHNYEMLSEQQMDLCQEQLKYTK